VDLCCRRTKSRGSRLRLSYTFLGLCLLGWVFRFVGVFSFVGVAPFRDRAFSVSSRRFFSRIFSFMACSLFSLDKRRGGASKAFGKVLSLIVVSGTFVATTFSGASVTTDLFDMDFGSATSFVSALATVLSNSFADSDGCAEVCDAVLDLVLWLFP
jgi:hypothetical protein